MGRFVTNVTVDLGASVGAPPLLVTSLVSGSCTNDVAGTCTQMHSLMLPVDPCRVQRAAFVLAATFACDVDGAGALLPCAAAQVPNTLHSVPNIVVSFDACAVATIYGIDASASSLRLYKDAARTTLVSGLVEQDAVMRGRCVLRASAKSQFDAVTLAQLAVVQDTASGPVNLGNQLAAPFVTLLSNASSSSPFEATWDFDIRVDQAFFAPTGVYYLEATLEMRFANTGALSRRRAVRATMGGPSTGLYSQAFRLNLSPTPVAAAANAGTVQITGSGSNNNTAADGALSPTATLAVIASVAAVAAVAALCAIVAVAIVAVRRRRRAAHACHNSDAPLAINSASLI